MDLQMALQSVRRINAFVTERTTILEVNLAMFHHVEA